MSSRPLGTAQLPDGTAGLTPFQVLQPFSNPVAVTLPWRPARCRSLPGCPLAPSCSGGAWNPQVVFIALDEPVWVTPARLSEAGPAGIGSRPGILFEGTGAESPRIRPQAGLPSEEPPDPPAPAGHSGFLPTPGVQLQGISTQRGLPLPVTCWSPPVTATASQPLAACQELPQPPHFLLGGLRLHSQPTPCAAGTAPRSSTCCLICTTDVLSGPLHHHDLL